MVDKSLICFQMYYDLAVRLVKGKTFFRISLKSVWKVVVEKTGGLVF